MKTHAFFFSITLLSLLCCGCGKTFCPGSPEELRDWFPYREGQMLSFADGRGDTITSKIKQFHVDENYSFQNCTKCDRGPFTCMFFTSTFEQGCPGFSLKEFEEWGASVWLKENLLEFSLVFALLILPGKNLQTF